jgi:hypothetical protein
MKIASLKIELSWTSELMLGGFYVGTHELVGIFFFLNFEIVPKNETVFAWFLISKQSQSRNKKKTFHNVIFSSNLRLVRVENIM